MLLPLLLFSLTILSHGRVLVDTAEGSNKLHKASCQYGILPGTFNPVEGPGSKWQLLTSSCRLNNYIAANEGDESGLLESELDKQSIMLIGDSTDYYLMRSYCDYAGGMRVQTENVIHNGFNYCNTNEVPGTLPIAQVYVSSLTQRANVSIMDYKGLPGLLGKVQYAHEMWRQHVMETEPTLVVLGGGLWDIFRWLRANGEDLEPIERQVQKTKEVSKELLVWWMKSVKQSIRDLQQIFPESRIIWRGYAMPKWNPETGQMVKDNIGTKAINADVRAAGMEAAMEMGLDVVDINNLVQYAHDPQQYLRDKHHANIEVYLEAVNVMLNVLMR